MDKQVLNNPIELTPDMSLYIMSIYQHTFAQLVANETTREPDPLTAAKVVADGWLPFRNKFLKGLEKVRHKSVFVREFINGERFARRLFSDIDANVRVWALQTLGCKMTPQEVLDNVEIVMEQPPVDPVNTPDWEQREVGPSDDMLGMKSATESVGGGMQGSALFRRGTLHELASDIANPVVREATHKALEAESDKARREGAAVVATDPR